MWRQYKKRLVAVPVVFGACATLTFVVVNGDLFSTPNHLIDDGVSKHQEALPENLPIALELNTSVDVSTDNTSSLLPTDSTNNTWNAKHSDLLRIMERHTFGLLSPDNSEIHSLGKYYPSVSELDMIDENTISELSLKLFNSRFRGNVFDNNINVTALGLAAFSFNMQRLENAVRFYVPNYRIGDPFPSIREWPNTEQPAIIRNILSEINWSQAAVNDDVVAKKIVNAKIVELNMYRLSSQILKQRLIDQIKHADTAVKQDNHEALTEPESFLDAKLLAYIHENYGR